MDHILNEEEKVKLREAGRIAAIVRREGALKLLKAGTSFLEVMDYCEKRILELGGGIAWAQLAVDSCAAHFCPEEDESGVTEAGQLIKIDTGVHIDGMIADNAMTIEVGAPGGPEGIGTGGKWHDMIMASRNALTAAIAKVKDGVAISELGAAQSVEAEKLGYVTIKNLSGHTLAPYKVHAGISIPSFDTGENEKVLAGMQIAIEPFVTNGQGMIKAAGRSTIFMLNGSVSTRSPYAKKVLSFVKSQKGLPFTTRWLTREFGKTPTVLALRELSRNRSFESYPPLVEVSGGMVAQFEHSMIVTKDGAEVYTRHPDDLW
ncbi:type II methionyl aminopeptidase [archaeon]|jgi:methionyl aminopeptidase|nr:type II methionyl aminopeptidase [archaeon]MBT6697537.1 type II methionyl aminopeptidase [archaeon]